MTLNFGELDESQNYGGELNFGELTKLPEDIEFEEFRKQYLKRKERGLGESVWEFAKAVPEGVSNVVQEDVLPAFNNDSMMASLFGLKGGEDLKGSWKALAKAPEVGLRDTWNMIKSVQSSIRDYFNTNLSEEEEIQRAFARYKFEMNYYNDARQKMIDASSGKFSEDINLLADFTDPTNLIPSLYGDKIIKSGLRKGMKGMAAGVSIASKGVEKAAAGVEYTLGLPAKGANKVLPKGGNVYRGLQGASILGIASEPFSGIATTMVLAGATEALAKVAKIAGREVSEVARVLASPSSHARFLFKLSTDENVSAKTRKLAARAYKMRGTRAYDVVFDALVAGVSSGAVQTALEFAKGKSAEEMGMAAGGGIALGSPVGAFQGSRGSGKSDQARSDQGIENYLANKGQMLNKDTIAALKKVDRDTLVTLSTLDEFSGLGNIRMQLMDETNFANLVGVSTKDAPSAYYNQKSQNIILNEGKIKEGAEVASRIVLHEHGHDIMRQMLGANPLMRRKILENFEDPNGKEYFFRDEQGSVLGSIKVNKEAQQFAADYAQKIGKTDQDYANSINGTDAHLLAEEIGAEQFAGLMRESPNVFAKYNKSFRHSLLGAARLALGKMGIVEPDSGSLLGSPISDTMLKNKGVANVFDNFIQGRNDHYRQRADDIDQGRRHEPRAGQSSDNRFTELFGGMGVSTAIGSHYMLKDQTMFDELSKQAAIDLQSTDKDLTGIGKGAEGKRLSDGVKAIFRGAGNYGKEAMDFIDFLQKTIDNRQMIKFGYRSAKWHQRTAYNPFYERSFTPIGWQISPKKPSTRLGKKVYPNLKVVGYDADVIMSNVELLHQAGLIKGTKADFLDQLAQHAQSVLQTEGEGRINPLGRGENELFTAALGLKESGQKLQDPKLNNFFTDPDNKIKHAYRSYDLGGMAGAASQNKGGFAFDYNNARHNYMPMLSGAGAEGSTIPQTLYMPSMSTRNNSDPARSRGLKNNILDDVLPKIKQEKFTPEQLIAEINKSKGAKEFLDDIGIDKKVLDEIKHKKTIDKSTLEFLISANQKILNFKVENSRGGDPLYEGYLEKGEYTNYEEMLFILPDSDMYLGSDKSGGHWENDRVLFHVRKSDRVLPNGEYSYHIEEIQSDWHQYAKRVGYTDQDAMLRTEIRLKELQKVIATHNRGWDAAINDEVEFTMRENIDLITEAETIQLKENNKNYFKSNPHVLAPSVKHHVDFIFAYNHEAHNYKKFKYHLEKINSYVSFFDKRVKSHFDKEIAEMHERDGFFPKEGTINFFDPDYAEKLTDVQKKHYDRYQNADGSNGYSEAYFEHRKALASESPYEDAGKVSAVDPDPNHPLVKDQRLLSDLTKLENNISNKIHNKEVLREQDAQLQSAKREKVELMVDQRQKQSPAPMKKSWHSLGLAEAINNAWNDGKSYVTWVTGDRSAQMNRLDEHFNFVNVTKLTRFEGEVEKDKLGNAVPDSGTQYKIHAESKEGRSIRRTIKDKEELAATIGKDAAEQALKDLKGAETGTQISVHDVEHKHIGRRVFYDKMMVDAAKRFAKLMGTRPPIKSEIALGTAMAEVQNKPTQEVWLMELPTKKPELPFYMPSISAQGEGSTTTGLVRDYGLKPMNQNFVKTGWLLPNGDFLDATYNDHDGTLNTFVKNNPDHPFAKKVAAIADGKERRTSRGTKVKPKEFRAFREDGIQAGAIRIVGKVGSGNPYNMMIEGKPNRTQKDLIERLADNSGVANVLTEDSIYYRLGVPQGEGKVFYKPPRGMFMPDLPTSPEPVVQTKKAYKLFRVGKDKKLYPLFVNANQPVRLGEWQVAEMGEQNPKTGKVKSKIGDLAYRAGWHASDLPMALHIGAKSNNKLVKPDTRRPNEVWAEVELADDFNWTDIAKERAEYNKDGTIKARTAQIVDQVPYNGHYRYKTNPNMIGEWLISGQMKVNKVLSPRQVKDINDRFNVADLSRREPQIKLTAKDLNYMPHIDGLQESSHGFIPPVQQEITQGHADKYFIPDFLVGENVFPVLGDRLMVGFHKCRSGNIYECRGGHDHAIYEGHKGQVAWACGQSGDKHDNVVKGLMKGIKRSSGYAATILMKEEALASNRTYARIMMDELEYDSFHVRGGKRVVEKHIKNAAKSLNMNIRNLEDLKAVTPTMSFDKRKALLSRVMSESYKTEIKKKAPKGYQAMHWKDLYKSLSSYKDEDGYRHGDIIHILQFDKNNPLIDLSEVGATPDPTYDVSFRGKIVHTMEGHVSAFDVFKEGLDIFAYDEAFNSSENKKPNPERTLQPDRRLGSSAFRVMQMRTAHDLMQRPLTKDNTLPSKPIKYKPEIKADEQSLYFRDEKNTKLRKQKKALL